jgi:hypothetical protein
MRDRPNKESAGEQYRRLAQECLEMVPTIQEGQGRVELIEMARFWLRLARSFQDDDSMAPAATKWEPHHAHGMAKSERQLSGLLGVLPCL